MLRPPERELLKVQKYGNSLFVAIPQWLCRELAVVRREYVLVARTPGRGYTVRFVEDFTRAKRHIQRDTT